MLALRRLGVASLQAGQAGEWSDDQTPQERPFRLGRARTGLGLVLVRYALLALAAYVMVAHLRLHPLGLIAGASCVALAITFEAFTYRR